MPESTTQGYFEQASQSEYSRHEPAPGTKEAILLNQEHAHTELSKSIGIESRDIPVERIKAYFERLGLTPPPLVIFDANPVTYAFIGQHDPQAADQLRDKHTVGYYASSINVALVAENKAKTVAERIRIAVHESGHGAAMSSFKIDRQDEANFSYRPTRGGYSVESSDGERLYGELLEEGRQEFLAGHFMDENYDTNLPASKAKGLLIPEVYVNAKSTFGVNVSEGAPAAIVLELLIAKNPALLDTIVKGPTSVDGLRKTAQELNAMQPGLYDRLRLASRDYSSFAAMARSVISEFYDGDDEAPVKAHQYVRRLMKDTYGV